MAATSAAKVEGKGGMASWALRSILMVDSSISASEGTCTMSWPSVRTCKPPLVNFRGVIDIADAVMDSGPPAALCTTVCWQHQ